MAEVLVGLLQKDLNSYLYLQPTWKPAAPIAPARGNSPWPISSSTPGLVLTNEELRTCEREGVNMQESIVKESPRRRIARRIGAAGMALATVLTLGACRATGGGYVGAPVDSGVIGVFTGDANFGFNFTCEVNGQEEAVIKGQITYHDDPAVKLVTPGATFPEIRLHGTVKNIFHGHHR